MAVAEAVSKYLQTKGIDTEVVKHPHSASSAETAELAHITGHRIAKGVLLQADGDFTVAVIPASHNLALGKVRDATGKPLVLAGEEELKGVFPDCEKGAVPALGMAYGLPTYVETALFDEPEVYFEGGDHETLVRLSSEEFETIFDGATAGDFSAGAI